VAQNRAPLVGYVRVSSVAGRRDERFQSPALQREVMERWATLRYGKSGHRWLDWLTDLDRSGVTIDRPALNQARDLAIANRASIVVYDMTRYSRSVPEGLSALERLAADDVRVLSASEDVDATTPEGELSLTMFLAMSQYQVRRIGASWRSVIERNKRDGWWHGVPPYGYRRANAAEARAVGRRAGVIVPDEVNAPRVQEVFRRYLAGESTYSIAKLGIANGWFTRESSVREILSNPAYAGMITWADRRVRRFKEGPRAGEVQRDNHGRPLREPIPGTERHVRGRHERLVSARIFVEVRRRLRSQAKPRIPRHIAARWSAAGLTKCGGCGRNLTFHDKSDVAADGRYLICGNKNCTAKVGSVRVTEFEVELAAAVREASSLLDVDDDLLRAMHESADDAPSVDVAALHTKRTRLHSAIAKGAAARLLAEVDADALSLDEVDAGLQVLRRDLAEVEKVIAAADPAPPEVVDFDELRRRGGTTLGSLWPEMTNDERVDALRALGAEVVVEPATGRRSPVAGRVKLRAPWVPLAQAS
jgi:site-specific DNA recombinase